MSKSEEKPGFIIYKSYYDPIRFLENEQLGRLFRAIFEWQISGKADPEPDILIAFNFFVQQFQIDNEKYLKQCETNRENGKKGGRPKKADGLLETERFLNKPNKADKDKDKDKDKDSTIVGNSLALPFTDPEFVKTWNQLRKQPKWRKKTVTALQKSLDRLSRYDVRFAIELMNTAIENGYQGVVYDDTPSRYEQWMKSHPQPQPDQGGEVNRDVYSAYDFD